MIKCCCCQTSLALVWTATRAPCSKGYQRPFELATLRLSNMIEILGTWGALAPADDNLLVQRGGSLASDALTLVALTLVSLFSD